MRVPLAHGTNVMGSRGLGDPSALQPTVVDNEVTPIDEIDFQSEQSFPASDPPSWSGASISRPRPARADLERDGADEVAVR